MPTATTTTIPQHTPYIIIRCTLVSYTTAVWSFSKSFPLFETHIY